jgi:hypothetical protein
VNAGASAVLFACPPRKCAEAAPHQPLLCSVCIVSSLSLLCSILCMWFVGAPAAPVPCLPRQCAETAASHGKRGNNRGTDGSRSDIASCVGTLPRQNPPYARLLLAWHVLYKFACVSLMCLLPTARHCRDALAHYTVSFYTGNHCWLHIHAHRGLSQLSCRLPARLLSAASTARYAAANEATRNKLHSMPSRFPRMKVRAALAMSVQPVLCSMVE